MGCPILKMKEKQPCKSLKGYYYFFVEIKYKKPYQNDRVAFHIRGQTHL